MVSRQAGRRASMQTGRELERHTNKHIGRHTDKNTYRQTGRLVGRQRDKHRNKLQTDLLDEKTSNRVPTTQVIMTFSLMTLSMIGLIATLS
jgi:hypothetical protein